MSSKKKRQKQDWLQCIKCSALLNSKDKEAHESICDKLSSAKHPLDIFHFCQNHGFVYNNSLFCLLRDASQKGDETKHIPKTLLRQIIFLHPSTMNLCKIVHGDRVAVFSASAEDKCSLHIAWASKNINPMNICVFEKTRFSKTEGIVLVVPYKKQLISASMISIRFPTRDSEIEPGNFEYVLISQNCDACIRPGSVLDFFYLGRFSEVVVNSITDAEGEKHQWRDSIPAKTAEKCNENVDKTLDELASNLSAIALNKTSERKLDESSNDELDENGSRFCSTPVRQNQLGRLRATDVTPSNDVADELNAQLHIPTFYVITSATKVEILTKQAVETVDEAKEFTISLGGLSEQLVQLRDIMLLPVQNSRQFLSLGIKPPKGVLIYGPPGTGKTVAVKAVAKQTGLTFIEVNGPEIYSKYAGEAEVSLKAVFKNAIKRAPSIIFIDEIDTLCPRREKSQSEQEKRAITTLLLLLDDVSNDASKHVVVIAATNKPDSLDPALRRPGRLDKEIEFGVPTATGRIEILKNMLARMKNNLLDSDVEEIASAAHGFTGADLECVCREASMHALKRYVRQDENANVQAEIWLIKEDVLYGLKQVKPSAMREVNLEVPKVYWNDIGAMDNVKQRLKQSVEWPLKYPEAFKRMGITPPRGLLMYGPPGCSKTMMAKALATESGLNFLAIKGPELFSKWVGESERAVREIFRKARAAAPSILFFDEIDALASERGSGGGSNVGDRVLAQLLTEMDGIEQLNGVTFIAATNRPDMIDEALLRPGRLDSIMYVPLPNAETRRAIFNLHFKTMPVKDVDALELAEVTENYSGAEIVAVCNEAGMKALEEVFNSADPGTELACKAVTKEHFYSALSAIKPRTSPDMIRFYDEYSTNKIRRKK